jgi:hypothetical protein
MGEETSVGRECLAGNFRQLVGKGGLPRGLARKVVAEDQQNQERQRTNHGQNVAGLL